MEANSNYFLHYLKILQAFTSFLGLKVNLKKSTLLGINADDELLHNLAALSGCEVEAWPIKYLDLPLGGNPRKVVFWESVVNKVAKRLASWKKAFLSKSGRFNTYSISSIFSLNLLLVSI